MLDISKITDQLYIAAHPKSRHSDLIRGYGVTLVLCMIFHPPALVYWRDHFQMLWLPTFDAPQLPMPLSRLVRGVNTALPVIEHGESVMVYCRQGRHRSVAMACCIMVGLGFSSTEAMELVKSKRPIADPDAWYIRDRILKFDEIWNSRT
jgi:hypothetical protein